MIEFFITITYPDIRPDKVVESLVMTIVPEMKPFDELSDTSHGSFERLLYCLRRRYGTKAEICLTIRPEKPKELNRS